MKRWLMTMAAAVLCCGMAVAADEGPLETVGKNPNADYYVATNDLVKVYRAMALEMADLTAQRCKVFLILGDEVDTPTGPATQVTLMEETDHDVKILKIFAVDEAGVVYETEWKEL